jgi:hypothetical protein
MGSARRYVVRQDKQGRPFFRTVGEQRIVQSPGEAAAALARSGVAESLAGRGEHQPGSCASY